jgi:outer membrane protein assembly factor BamB
MTLLRRLLQRILATTFVALFPCLANAADWPQFRGPGSTGVSEEGNPPIHFGPGTNVVWKTALPGGQSSPVIIGERIFVTSHHEGKLQTLCLDRTDGRILWTRDVAPEKVEPAHRIGSPAASTSAADGQRVYSYFGSFGLVCYDHEGAEQWYQRLPIPVVEFGTGTSPILTGDLLILLCDQDEDSYLLAVDKRTGKSVWRTERTEFRRGFSSPIVWRHQHGEEVITTGNLRLVAYDLKSGRENWWVHGLSRVICTSPVATGDLLFVSTWTTGGDAGSRMVMDPFADYAARQDANKDGKITEEEMAKDSFRGRYGQIDVNKDGFITEAEWESMRAIFDRAENSVMAIRPGGKGDVTASHVVWKQQRGLPYVPSPLHYDGRLYLVKNGGMVSCLDARTGEYHYQEERLGVVGDYYASPVAADGRIYAIAQRGMAVVFKTGAPLEVLAKNDLREEVFATPAIAGDVLYVRTTGHLYAFSERKKASVSP